MVLPSRRSRSSGPISINIMRLSIVFLVGIVYLASVLELSPENKHHWAPPFLDFLLSPSDDTPSASLFNHHDIIHGSSNMTAGPIAMERMNVPKLRSKLKIKMGETQHLGIMVDAGRHYFSIAWLEALLQYMSGLGYNLLHLRLTDDQAFSLKLQSHPGMARTAPFYDHVYEADDLKLLVTKAKKLGIAILPEVNVPGHAGSWGSQFVVPCPRFICTHGYGIPLNIASKDLMSMINDILLGVKDIFGTDYLHLGGNELEQAKGCYEEARQEIPDYADFERLLAEIVQDLGFVNVIRWEQSESNATQVKRAGDITHYWRKSIDDYGEMSPEFFSSSPGLYMDVNGDDNAYRIYQEVRKNQDLQPQGIVVGTFELGVDWWMDRNVFGRMIAVSMAFLPKQDHENELGFLQEYEKQCTKLLGKENEICRSDGQPISPSQKWRVEQWEPRFLDWKIHVCTGLTDPFDERVMRTVQPLSSEFNTRQAEEIALARGIFIDRLQSRESHAMPQKLIIANKYGKPHVNHDAYIYPPIPNQQALFEHVIGHTGITVDIARYYFPIERLQELVKRLSVLGFNTLHLRLVDDFSFAVQTLSHPDVAFPARSGGRVYPYKAFHDLVEFAHSLSVEIVPEINMLSRAGGWFAAGILAPCPNHICDQGYGIPLNLTNVPLMALVSNVIEEMRYIFNGPFVHLGYDERADSSRCLKEADIQVNFNEIEHKIAALLSVIEVPQRLVIRWETSNKDPHDSDRVRAGSITHYQWNNPPEDVKHPFFVSTDVRFDKGNDNAYEIYQKACAYTKGKLVLGVLAGTMEMSPQAWSGRNVEGKLIALAIGLSSRKEMNQDDFFKLYNSTCENLKIEGDIVDLQGKSRWSAHHWEEELTSERERRTNSTCDRMTSTVKSRKMKDYFSS